MQRKKMRKDYHSRHAELRKERIAEACRIVKKYDGNIPQKILAPLCGYADQRSFSLAFKTERGITFTQWRLKQGYSRQAYNCTRPYGGFTND